MLIWNRFGVAAVQAGLNAAVEAGSSLLRMGGPGNRQKTNTQIFHARQIHRYALFSFGIKQC